MKTQFITLLAFGVLAGMGGRVHADERGYFAGGASAPTYGTSRLLVQSDGVPLFFYTNPRYSSSFYGSPGNAPYYCASSTRASFYRRYMYNPWFTNKVRVHYEIIADSNTTSSVQTALAERGYYRGAVDGVLGPMTWEAICHYQHSRGFHQTGAIDNALLRSLRIR